MKRSATTALSQKLTKSPKRDAPKTPTKVASPTKNAAPSLSPLKLKEPHPLHEKFEKERAVCATSILDFCQKRDIDVFESRCRSILEPESPPKKVTGVMYWMWRDKRVDDNWALLHSQKIALENECPLYVLYCLPKKVGEMTNRHYRFMLDGLREVADRLAKLNITFLLMRMEPTECITVEALNGLNVQTVVCDYSPLRHHKNWVSKVVENIQDSEDMELLQVDAHNIVPVWVASEKERIRAQFLRPLITNFLPDYQCEFPPVVKHPHGSDLTTRKPNFEKASKFVGASIPDGSTPAKWKPGTHAAYKTLDKFIKHKFKGYSKGRNDPNAGVQSDMSPWFNHGQISTQRVLLHVSQFAKASDDNMKEFVEEAVIQRELSENFCHYNEHYDSLKGASNWAQKTIKEHSKDVREHIYTLEQFERAKTHDELWNACQNQLVRERKIAGYLRMYWAKKILEWTPSAAVALDISILLNDRYAIDGNDPNGYTGCMWSICGATDRAFTERDVFGKVRCMTYGGCKRKFDVAKFVSKYN